MTPDASVDYLIIGSGIAGLRAAIALAGARVVMLTKADPRAGNTDYAQGGIAAALGPDDSPDRHAEDTLAAGDGLCDPAAVRVLVEDGRASVTELIDWGAAFDRDPQGHLDLAREGAHAVRRVLHARDATGREIGRVLAARAAAPSLVVQEYATAVQLVTSGGRVSGARFLDRVGALHEVRAPATLIATGGAGQVYRETTNPAVATGDGITLGYLAGARVTDLEFVQFHPTALAVPGAPRYLLSEALRGEGARLVNSAGEPFMSQYDARGDLAPRDVVARAIVREARRTGAPVSLSLAHLPAADVRSRFPLIAALCRRVGLDVATDLLPVSPAAHYVMGGLATDMDGRTSLPGLFAAGEAACTGVHGANRLASNSLLEGLVFGRRAGEAMRGWNGTDWPGPLSRAQESTTHSGPVAIAPIDEHDIADRMWRLAGVFRDATGLVDLNSYLEPAWQDVRARLAAGQSVSAATWRAVSILAVARLIARAAVRREESRGAHWRDDFPRKDEVHWKRRAYDAI